MWQDLAISVAQIVFIMALVPAIIGNEKPPFITSLATGVALLIITASYVSLGLWFSALMCGLATTGWFILAYQRLRMR